MHKYCHHWPRISTFTLVMFSAALSGCGGFPIALEDVPWQPPPSPSLGKCPDLDGVYADQEFLMRRIFFPPPGKDLFFQRWQSFDPAPQPEFEKIPYPDQKERDDANNFVTHIKIKQGFAHSQLMHKSGRHFYSALVRLDSLPNPIDHKFGLEWFFTCTPEELIHRKIEARMGAGPLVPFSTDGHVSAYEYRFKKLPNGHLLMHMQKRFWSPGDPPGKVSEDVIRVFPKYELPSK